MDQPKEGFPIYHIEDLFPDQLAVIELLGSPPIIGSHGTSIFLSDPSRDVRPPHNRAMGSDTVTSIGAAHGVTYTCPVVMMLDRPKMILPNGDVSEVQADGVAPSLAHWGSVIGALRKEGRHQENLSPRQSGDLRIVDRQVP